MLLFIILSVISIICLLLILTPYSQTGGTMPRPFSDINEIHGIDVVGSVNGQVPSLTREDWPLISKQLEHTYYGHDIPLSHEDRKPGKIENPLQISHNLGVRCSPDCCPSPYSCDRGCLCTTK